MALRLNGYVFIRHVFVFDFIIFVLGKENNSAQSAERQLQYIVEVPLGKIDVNWKVPIGVGTFGSLLHHPNILTFMGMSIKKNDVLNVVHSDVKPANVLVSKPCRISKVINSAHRIEAKNSLKFLTVARRSND